MAKNYRSKARQDQTSYGEGYLTKEDHEKTRRFLQNQGIGGSEKGRAHKILKKSFGEYDEKEVRDYLINKVVINYQDCRFQDLASDLENLKKYGLEISIPPSEELEKNHKSVIRFLKKDLGIEQIIRQTYLFEN